MSDEEALEWIEGWLDAGVQPLSDADVRWDLFDELVAASRFPNRSRAIEEAVAEKLARMERSRLARESAKLDPSFERRLAEEGLGEDVGEWPEY